MDKTLFAQSAIFKDLRPDELERVAEVCDVFELKAGEYVFREGDVGDRLFIIEEGEVRISRVVPGTGDSTVGGAHAQSAPQDDQ